jgi:hypothetical protein
VAQGCGGASGSGGGRERRSTGATGGCVSGRPSIGVTSCRGRDRSKLAGP